MQFATEILMLLLGIIIGGGAAWLYNNKQGDSRQAKSRLEKCEQQNAQLKQDWQDHIAEYRSIATNLAEMSSHIERQIEDAEGLLKPQEDNGPQFPFFSSEATEILKSVNRKKREKSVIDNQPLDYSGKASGVFQGQPESYKETH
jgi:uncharacterized membrane-anchored protein YhcB (DUF1043 family)